MHFKLKGMFISFYRLCSKQERMCDILFLYSKKLANAFVQSKNAQISNYFMNNSTQKAWFKCSIRFKCIKHKYLGLHL